jgi:hypothetical protein
MIFRSLNHEGARPSVGPSGGAGRRSNHARLVAIAGSLILGATGLSALSGSAHASQVAPLIKPTDHFPNGETPETFQGPVGRADCGPGSNPETSDIQGSVSVADRDSGRSSQGYWCNMALVGNYGPQSPLPFEGAEWQLARYKDSSGHQCAYYSQRTWNPVSKGVTQKRPGTVVVDVSDPTDPKFSENLATPGMYDPWETLKVSEQRGLLAAVQVGDAEAASFMGIYDIKDDCRHPKELFDGPVTAINHEGNFSYDGMTYYTGGLQPGIVSAIDVTDPRNPKLLTTFFAKYGIHGYSTSVDGKRLFISHINEDWPYTLYGGKGGNGGRGVEGDPSQPPPTNGDTMSGGNGIGIYDVSEIQDRKPNPTVHLVSALEYQDGQLGQHTLNFVKGGTPYAMEISEAGHGGARIIDISDEQHPKVVTKLKTEIMMTRNNARATSETFRPPKEIGGDLTFAYNLHYCNIDKRLDPVMVACSGFEQGLRLFDIRDLKHPKELGYYNPGGDGTRQPGGWGGTYSGYTTAMPQFDPTNQHIWFTDNDRGFFVVKPINGTWISDVTEETASHGV